MPGRNLPTLSYVFVAVALGCCPAAAVLAAGVDPAQRTADMPDSWLVLYNVDPVYGTESTAWAVWYAAQYGIPADNLLPLSLPTNAEHLATFKMADAYVLGPVRAYLDDNPDVQERVMGIVLGFGLPGSFGAAPLSPEIGGWSLASALQDPYNPATDGMFGFGDNPAYAAAADLSLNLPAQRLTRATMPTQPGDRPRFLVGRIDAPSLAEAMQLTTRAQFLASNGLSPASDLAYWDDYDPSSPSGPLWAALNISVTQECIPATAWMQFDLDANGGHVAAAFRFHHYRVSGWGPFLLSGGGGSRVLAYDLDSFGSITVRTTGETGYNFAGGGSPIVGVFVPNALAAGYAAAIGATAEPTVAGAPHPGVVVAAFQRGWTLGEAFFLGTGTEHGFWNVVGDPLLRLQNWWDITDCNGNGIADECEDCNGNDIADECEIAAGSAEDCDDNGVPDACEFTDCNANGVGDACEIAAGSSSDCDADGIPDECTGGGVFADCNANGAHDACDLSTGASADCNTNGIPDECDTTQPTATFFYDGFFNAGAPDLLRWPSCNAATSTSQFVSPQRALRFLAWRQATTAAIDMADASEAELSFWTLPQGTCAGIDLAVDYWTGAAWTSLVNISGGAAQETWAQHTVPLPQAAIRPALQLRFRNTIVGTCPGDKVWFLDDVRVRGRLVDCNANLVPDLCESSASGGSVDFDRNGVVDASDYAALNACMGPPCGGETCDGAEYPDACCRYVDADGDGDVDLADYARLQLDFTTP